MQVYNNSYGTTEDIYTDFEDYRFRFHDFDELEGLLGNDSEESEEMDINEIEESDEI